MRTERTKIFTGNSNPELASRVSNILNISLGQIEVGQFSDGETRVEIHESVRGDHAYVIQSTCFPTNDNLIELLSIVDALRRSGTKVITAVIPYYGYSRQDRRPEYSRVPITSKLTADVIQTAGVDSVIMVDIHSKQQQGFFNIPSINISAAPNFVADIWAHRMETPHNVVIVSPDVGGVSRARNVAKQLMDRDLAIIDKRRPKANESEVMNIIGEVDGKTAILIDDMVDTAGTLCKAATALKERKATQVIAYCTHPVLSGDAFNNIENSDIDELVVTDTIPLREQYSKIRVISIASLIAETIHRHRLKQSVSEIYVN